MIRPKALCFIIASCMATHGHETHAFISCKHATISCSRGGLCSSYWQSYATRCIALLVAIFPLLCLFWWQMQQAAVCQSACCNSDPLLLGLGNKVGPLTLSATPLQAALRRAARHRGCTTSTPTTVSAPALAASTARAPLPQPRSRALTRPSAPHQGSVASGSLIHQSASIARLCGGATQFE
jgi:hypothetical protein